MRHYLRWGSLLAALSGFAFWLRSRRNRKINPDSLGRVSEQWFMDNRHQL